MMARVAASSGGPFCGARSGGEARAKSGKGGVRQGRRQAVLRVFPEAILHKNTHLGDADNVCDTREDSHGKFEVTVTAHTMKDLTQLDSLPQSAEVQVTHGWGTEIYSGSAG